MFAPPTDEYRAALTAAGHHDLDAGRISRLVQRMPRGRDECGSLVGGLGNTMGGGQHDDSMTVESETQSETPLLMVNLIYANWQK